MVLLDDRTEGDDCLVLGLEGRMEGMGWLCVVMSACVCEWVPTWSARLDSLTTCQFL